jgi:hypothetical protein
MPARGTYQTTYLLPVRPHICCHLLNGVTQCDTLSDATGLPWTMET